MSFGATKLLSASGGEDAYEIDQSITLDVGDAPKLRRTPSSAGNRRTFTFSTWVKRASLGNGGTAGSGTANTGGGGGGNRSPGGTCGASGTGGSGVVIIRYKYQN